MITMTLHGLLSWLCVLVTAMLWPLSLGAEQLRILTSMPPSFYAPFVESFTEANPDVDVVVLNKNTNAAVDELLRGNSRAFDIFWSSSPEAFELLIENDVVAGGDTPLMFPFAYSALGWATRGGSGAPDLMDWDSLLAPELADTIAMARPSRSGSTHILLERFLQVRGWDEGWAYLLELSGNLSTLTARSFTVLEGVANGRFERGLTIDFLAHSYHPQKLRMTYGTPVMATPAGIAVLAGGAARQSAEAFNAFVVSEEGQRLLLDPRISRTPYAASIRTQAVDPYHQIIENALSLTWLNYDAGLASRRYWAVNTLFDVFVFEHFERRKQLWQRLRELEATPDLGDRRNLIAARRLLVRMPVGDNNLTQEGTPTNATAFSALSPQQEEQLAAWRRAAQVQLLEAENLLAPFENLPTTGKTLP